MLLEFKVSMNEVLLCADNQAAIHMVNNKASTPRKKLIDLQLQFSKVKVLPGNIVTNYVPYASNIADIFTKPLACVAQFFQR